LEINNTLSYVQPHSGEFVVLRTSREWEGRSPGQLIQNPEEQWFSTCFQYWSYRPIKGASEPSKQPAAHVIMIKGEHQSFDNDDDENGTTQAGGAAAAPPVSSNHGFSICLMQVQQCIYQKTISIN
jgi:hypothetical protein